jgi:hypothetical protein
LGINYKVYSKIRGKFVKDSLDSGEDNIQVSHTYNLVNKNNNNLHQSGHRVGNLTKAKKKLNGVVENEG